MQRREANAPNIFNKNIHRHQNQLATQKTGPILQLYTVKKTGGFPVPSRDVTYQTKFDKWHPDLDRKTANIFLQCMPQVYRYDESFPFTPK